MNQNKVEYSSFSEFYPFYLSQHQNLLCRRLHFIGLLIVLLMFVYILITAQWILLLILPIIAYGFAWTGHFFFEKNIPATFTYPLLSFIGDWVMFKDIILRKIKI